MVNSQLDLRLIDFGFSRKVEPNQRCHEKLGTEGYISPEIRNRNYDAKKADMFALGVILFILYTGYPPFGSSRYTDPYFKIFTENNDKFWTVHSRNKPQGFYSEEFINLINLLLCPEARRLTVE